VTLRAILVLGGYWDWIPSGKAERVPATRSMLSTLEANSDQCLTSQALLAHFDLAWRCFFKFHHDLSSILNSDHQNIQSLLHIIFLSLALSVTPTILQPHSFNLSLHNSALHRLSLSFKMRTSTAASFALLGLAIATPVPQDIDFDAYDAVPVLPDIAAPVGASIVSTVSYNPTSAASAVCLCLQLIRAILATAS
jgi:hypothetical protein